MAHGGQGTRTRRAPHLKREGPRVEQGEAACRGQRLAPSLQRAGAAPGSEAQTEWRIALPASLL